MVTLVSQVAIAGHRKWNVRTLLRPDIFESGGSPLTTGRVKSGQTAETAEVCHVQCEYVAHPVDVHARRQPCVVYLNSQDAVLQDDAPPLPLDGLTVRQESHASLDHADIPFGFGDG